MKETPKPFIHYYRERTSKGACITLSTLRRPTGLETFIRWLGPLKIWASVGISIAVFCYGFATLSAFADDWFRNTEAAREIEVGKEIVAEANAEAAWEAAEQAWSNPVIGCEYMIPWFVGTALPAKITFRGWVDSVALLPQTGNRIGDFRRVKHNDHIWVWAASAGAVPTWVDP